MQLPLGRGFLLTFVNPGQNLLMNGAIDSSAQHSQPGRIGCKSSSDSKISLRIRIFVHKRVLKVVKFAVVIDIVQTLIFITSSSARGNCCLWPRRRGSSSMNLP